jgi:hypothetical protein
MRISEYNTNVLKTFVGLLNLLIDNFGYQESGYKRPFTPRTNRDSRPVEVDTYSPPQSDNGANVD